MVGINNREHMMKNLIKFTLAAAMLASPAFSGGWEASRLDTSMMYNDGSYAEVGTSSITYDVKGIQDLKCTFQSIKWLKIKTEPHSVLKCNMGDNFDIGLTNYLSGADST